MTTKLSCQDCSWSDKCQSEALKAFFRQLPRPILTKNNIGSCDFFTGPDKDIKFVNVHW